MNTGRGMDWQEIDTFLVLAEELHFGRTAERLRLSQARVSQTIKKLERRFGSPLFDRTTRRVSLTPIGRQLCADLGPAHQIILDGIAKATTAGRGIAGVLRVGFLGPVAGRVVLAAYETLRPGGLEVQICETQIADPCRPLRDGEVDVLLTQLPVEEPGFTTGKVVISEPRVLAVSAEHPFARRASVSLEDLARDTTFRPAGSPTRHWMDTHLPWHTPRGKPIEHRLAVATFQELLALVAAGKGICPVAAHNVRYHARPDVAFVPIDAAPPLEFGFVWRTSADTSRVQAFVAATDAMIDRWGGPATAATH